MTGVVESTCKAGSCDATTATVETYNSGGTRTVSCDGCGRQYRVPKKIRSEGPYQEGDDAR